MTIGVTPGRVVVEEVPAAEVSRLTTGGHP